MTTVKIRTYVPTDKWLEGKITGTGPRWRLLEEQDVPRTARGKYAHVPYSSEDHIRDKQQEVELED